MNFAISTFVVIFSLINFTSAGAFACSIPKSVENVARYYANEDGAATYAVGKDGTSVEVDGREAVVIGFAYSVNGSLSIGEATIDKKTCTTLRTSTDLTTRSSLK